MKITKFGHCCLLIEEAGVRILTDPGEWNDLPRNTGHIDILLITHEHPDHLDPAKIKRVLVENSELQILTNKGVGKILDEQIISHQLLESGQSTTIKNILVEAFGEKHAAVYPTLPAVDNTGYLIGGKLFVPGDNFTLPNKPVEILAVPITAPWLKLAESIDYTRRVKPKLAFPVHDGALKYPGPSFSLPEKVLGLEKIQFVVLEPNTPFDIPI